MDVGSAGADPGAAQGVNQWPGANPTTVRQADTTDYQSFETVPGQQQTVTHRGVPVGYVNKYNDPGHGPLFAATLADHVHDQNPTVAKRIKGFTQSADAARNVVERHRDVAQIENTSGWRPDPAGGPNLPGH